MIRINLAGEVDDNSEKKVILRDFLIVSCICATIYFSIEYHADKIQNQISITEAKLEEQINTQKRMKQDIEKSKQTKQKIDLVKSKTRSILALGEGRKIPVVLLDNLQMRHPERMWFSKMSYSKSSGLLTLNGYALDHTVIADYIKRLKEMEKIETSETGPLQDFIPQQLMKFNLTTKATKSDSEKNEIKTLESVILTSLKSEEFEGVTLQKFEIKIKIQAG